MLIYTAASLLHFVHNATYLHDYPNMPAWLTPLGVYAVWFAIVAVGVLGYWIYRGVQRMMGLVLIAIYAVLGFGGLDHYVVAPLSAHTFAMHLTIALEGITAALLLIATLQRAMLKLPSTD